MIFRAEKPEDIDSLRTLIYTTFENHPQHPPGAKPTEHLILDQLRVREELTLSLIAEQDGDIIGHIAFSPITIDGEVCAWYGVGPVAVARANQNKGIGQQLVIKGMEQMRQQGAHGFVLVGNPQFYGRFGFEPKDGLTMPEVPSPYFMAKSYTEPTPTGSVAFSPAFAVGH